jgi:nucleotide-binding universal stress UspA family protein
MALVVAALDDSPALTPTVRAARAMAALLDAELSGIHVAEPGSPDADALTSRAGFPVAVEPGEVVPRLLVDIDAPDVLLAVVGARDRPGPAAQAGHVACELACATSTPLLVVPPGSPLGTHGTVSRALLPLDGDPHTTAQTRELVDRLTRAGVELVATHVFDPRHPPRYLDTPGYELASWRHEFLARHGRPGQRLQLRTGPVWDAVLAGAIEAEADLIVLAWAQHLEPGRAAVVREAMANPTLPVLLLPDIPSSRDGRDAERTQPGRGR